MLTAKWLVKQFKEEKNIDILVAFVTRLRATYFELCYSEELTKFEDDEVYIKFAQVVKKAKLTHNKKMTESVEDTLYDYFFETEWKKSMLKVQVLKDFIEEIDLKELSDEILNEEIESVNFDKENWFDTSSKIQKLYSENESLVLKKELIKQNETEALENNEEYKKILQEYEETVSEITERLNSAYDEAVKWVTWLDKIKEINSQIKENKSLVDEFLEHEFEKWDLSKIKITWSKWETLVAYTYVYLWKKEENE